MESIIDMIADKHIWNMYYENREACAHLNKKELEELRTFIETEGYKTIAQGIVDGSYQFSIPKIARINKGSSAKKRIVYQYQTDEVWVLKLVSYLMHSFDELFCDNCYSFQKNHTVIHAVEKILRIKEIDKKYCLKVDIQNYFNSIPADKLCEMIHEHIAEDPKLVQALCKLLLQNKAYDSCSKEIVYGNRGAMAGVPISPFLANLYLKDVDEYFFDNGVLYFRYADDILIFADSSEHMEVCKELLFSKIKEKGLEINRNKYKIIEPGEPIEFLGVKYHNGIVDISDNTKKKLFAKIRRKARALYRWRMRKQASFEQAAYVMIRIFNKKFYDLQDSGDFCWSKWFFPIINTDASLKKIDAYMLQYIRYLLNGKHNKGNYKITYEKIKELGYHSLVNVYYRS